MVVVQLQVPIRSQPPASLAGTHMHVEAGSGGPDVTLTRQVPPPLLASTRLRLLDAPAQLSPGSVGVQRQQSVGRFESMGGRGRLTLQ